MPTDQTSSNLLTNEVQLRKLNGMKYRLVPQSGGIMMPMAMPKLLGNGCYGRAAKELY